MNVVEVNLGEQRRSPGGHRTSEELVEALQTEVAHPLRLVFELADLFNQLTREALRCLEEVVLRVVEAKLLVVVGVDVAENLVLVNCGGGRIVRWHCHLTRPPG